MRAVITAGGTVDGAFAERIGTPLKALAPLRGRTLLDVVLGACGEAGLDGIAVVGGAAVRAHLRHRDVRVVDDAGTGAGNVLAALDAWPGERFVYLTSDLPFVGGAAVADLMARSAPFDVAMGLASEAAYRTRFPAAPRAGAALRGERVVNACGFVIDGAAVPPLRAFATRFFEARKSLPSMARLLGPALLLRFALRRLGVADIERHASLTLGLRVGAVRDCDPALCYDIDTFADYEDACRRSV